MEIYNNAGAAILSLKNGETTDNLIVSAIQTLPISAISAIMPVAKTKGPTAQWVEPFFRDDKVELVSTPIDVFIEANKRKRLEFTCIAADDIRMMYTPEAFKSIIQGWMLFYKNQSERKQLIDILKSPIIAGVPSFASTPNLINNPTEDQINSARNQILKCMLDIGKDFQLGDAPYSIVAPYELGYACLELKAMKAKINVLYDDTIDKVYVFPTGTQGLDRAGFTVFQYADEIQRSIDPDTGSEVYFMYNRSAVILNPVHQRHPIVRTIDIV